MAGETLITIVGNLTRDPEVRQAGQAQATGFAVAVNERKFNRDTNAWEDGDAVFWECTAWRNLGTNVAQTLRKGMSVIVHGKIKQRSYEKDGVKRTVTEIEVEAMGPNLGNQVAQVQKVTANQGQQQAPQQGGYPQQGVPQGYPQQAPQGYPQQQPYAGPPQQPYGGFQGPPQQAYPAQQAPAQPQGGFPDARTYQPPQPGAAPAYGDDTPF